MRSLIALALLLPLAAAPLVAGDDGKATATAQPAEEGFSAIDQADLSKAVAAKQVVLIDCNGSASYAKHHIPGAVDFEKSADLAKVLPQDKSALVVAYCGGPMCGAWQEGAKAAQALGYTNVKHFAGGISGWLASGAPVDR